MSPAPDNASMRRLLRPIGWTVWQAVLEHAVDTDGVLVAAVSVRSLADELGLAKDTVAAALRRLTAHGLIERQPQPRSDSRFSPGCYAFHPTLPPSAPTPSPSPRPTSSTTTLPTTAIRATVPTITPTDSPSAAPTAPIPTPPSQLSLLDLQPTAPTSPLLLRRTCISDAGHARGTGAASC